DYYCQSFDNSHWVF
nr:immunoglobulin light chain junction region [Macaca mulatta]